jgi:hypothetical protein
MVPKMGLWGQMEETEGAQSASGAGADMPATVLGLTRASRATADAFPELEKMCERKEFSHFRAGKPAGAKAQFARAAALDLAASEKSELAQQQHLGKTT